MRINYAVKYTVMHKRSRTLTTHNMHAGVCVCVCVLIWLCANRTAGMQRGESAHRKYPHVTHVLVTRMYSLAPLIQIAID